MKVLEPTKRNAGTSTGLGYVDAPKYREDIDGLRAIAVVTVLLFHLDWLTYGYLGVDVFFVISGYLITGILARDASLGRLSIARFYERRLKRIGPLVFVTAAVALAIGWFVMLPDDLENLAQSVIATTFFANNILSYLTIFDYWDVFNEYKPLMHTWSLGIEEQYYVFYPLLFLVIPSSRMRTLFAIVAVTAVLSYGAYLGIESESEKFYLLHTRFWELAVGGLVALQLPGRLVVTKLRAILLAGLVLMLCLPWTGIGAEVRLTLTVLLSAGVLGTAERGGWATRWLTWSAVRYIGLISFSLYMWHQIVYAYARYAVFEEISVPVGIGLILLTFGLSALSYRFVEEPFRRGLLSTRALAISLGIGFAALVVGAGYIYVKAGVVRDVPELDAYASLAKRGQHAVFNARIRDLDVPFANTGRTRVLVVGNSFARDWANTLLSSAYASCIDLSYIERYEDWIEDPRHGEADVIFISTLKKGRFEDLPNVGEADTSKIVILGTKYFGSNSGIYFNNDSEDRCEQTVEIGEEAADLERTLREDWPGHFFSIMDVLKDERGRIPVFTRECKFFSQDTRHLTEAGAAELGRLLYEGNELSEYGLCSE